MIDLRGIVSYTDFLVICSGNTERQTKAIHDAIHAELKHEDGLLPRRTSGDREARWILLDYLDVVVHIFTPDARAFYRLDQLWGEAPAAPSADPSVRPTCEHVFVLSTNAKGAIAETKIAAAATELGIPVLRPIVEHSRYDLAFEIGGRILRVQCKWAALDRARSVIKASTCSHVVVHPTGTSSLALRRGRDRSASRCTAATLDRCYLLPVASGRWHAAAISLRLSPPRNGQRACINLASDFEFPGAVAQLEERRAGTRRSAVRAP